MPSSGLLNPYSPGHGPPSPVMSDISDSGSAWSPPSPTLSNHSGRFPSTLQLRDNRPEEKSGLSSLGLLNPDSFRHRHDRKGSNATSVTDVARSDDLHHSHSNTTSVTNVDQLPPRSPSITEKKVSYVEEGGSSTENNSKKGKKPRDINDQEDGDLHTSHQIELAQDAAIDPAPFNFKPYQLAHMLDPKCVDTLIAFNGIDGLLRGLGVNPDTGLATKPQLPNSPETTSRKLSLGAGEGASQRHDPVNMPAAQYSNNAGPAIIITSPDETPSGNDSPAFLATLEDRRRVYGENVLPIRISKTLLQLMWAALKDKVLVSEDSFPSSSLF